MAILPALVALKSVLPSLVGPPLATYALLRLLSEPSIFIVVPLCVLSVPAYFFVSITWRNSKYTRDAEKNGARLPPRVEDGSLLGRNTSRALMKEFEGGYLGDTFFKWSAQYGWTFRINLIGEDVVVTSEPEYIKAILATNFNGFKKNTEARFLEDMLGSGVFNADGEIWKFHRGITRPFFSRDRISDFETFDAHTLASLSALSARLATGAPVDFQDLVSRYTIDTATAFLFGADVRSLAAGLPYPGKDRADSGKQADAFANAFLAAQTHIARRSRRGLIWPLFELRASEHEQNLKTIREFVEPLIAKAVQRAEDAGEKVGEGEKKEVEEGETMLDYMVKSTRDRVLLYDETLNILLAGRDTTASLLTSAVYALSQNPQIFAKLREEILSVVGLERAPGPDDVRQMKYLRAVLNETLRLWPPVPFNARRTIEPTLWPSKTPGEKPFYIPAHTRVNYSVLLMHRRTDLWGPDALVFDPARFLDHRVSYLTSNNFIFLPFNAGPRICLGQQFAYNEATVFLVRLLQRYKGVALAEDVQRPSRWAEEGRERVHMKSHLTLYASGGLWARFTPADDETA